jgi:membrane fusion protein (multidrug efflux system)
MIIGSCGNRPERLKAEKQTPARVVPVLVETIIYRDLTQTIPVSGKLEGSLDMVMSSETNGKITVLYKSLGDKVNKGEELGAIDNLEYKILLEQAKASLLAAEATYELAEITWKTNEKLFQESKISQLEHIQSKSSFLNATSGVQAAKANAERAQKAYDNSILIIPVSGYIANLPIQTGEFITIGKPIAHIVETNKLKIKTGIGETDIGKIKTGQMVTIKDHVYHREWQAKVTGIGRKIVAGTANYPIEMELENSEQILLPGMLVQAQITGNTSKNVIYTNLNHILRQYDETYVFVIDENHIARKRIVILGETIAENVIVKAGLEIGDLLVTEGIANLEDGISVEIRKI